jgi:hypothetical protein
MNAGLPISEKRLMTKNPPSNEKGELESDTVIIY